MQKSVSYFEDLLDQNKPAQVLKELGKVKTKDWQSLIIIAEAQRMLGSFEEAIKNYKQALKNISKTATEDKIDLLLALAKCERTLGKASSAYKNASLAEKLAQKEELEDFAVLALQERALALRAQGKLQDAKVLLNTTLNYYTEQGEIAGQSFIYWALGGISRLEGNFAQGISEFKKAITLAKRAKDNIATAYAVCGLAGISRIAGDIKACVRNYQLAEKLFKNTDDVFGKAYTNCGLANGLRQLGEYKKAMKHYIVADKLYSSINDTVDLGFVKWGKADILKHQGNLKAALKTLLEAKKLFGASDEIRGQLLTEISLAQIYYLQGQRKQADSIFEKAFARAKKEGLRTYLESLT